MLVQDAKQFFNHFLKCRQLNSFLMRTWTNKNKMFLVVKTDLKQFYFFFCLQLKSLNL